MNRNHPRVERYRGCWQRAVDDEYVVDAYLCAIDPRYPTPPAGHLAALEARFVEVAPAYARRRSIEQASWLAVGVPGDVVVRAGLTQPRRICRRR